MNDRLTVIIADNSEAFLMYMSILLQRLDFEVLPVSSGTHVVKMAKAVRPNLVIVGTSLPEMNGPEVLEALRAEPELAEIPVLLSGDADEEATCREHDCQGYLTKPIELDRLHAALERCRLHPHSHRRHLRAAFPQKVVLTFNYKTYECQAVTLSTGGIYIRRMLPLPAGCLLDVKIPLPDGREMTLEGEVIYTKQLSEDRFTMPPGMAIRFLTVDAEQTAALDAIIRNLLIGDLVEEQTEPVIKG